MEFGSSRVYETELWSSSGNKLADISSLCQQREFILTRNDVASYTFQLDLTSFEAFCSSINADPSTLLAPYQTDVKLKRNGTYLFVAQVVGLEFDLQTNDTGVNPETGTYNNVTSITETVTVTAAGYLSILADRYIDGVTYTNEDPCQVAIDMINTTQAQTYGNFGITIAESPYMTGEQWTGTLTQQQILEQLQSLAAIPTSPFDFAIDANKVFNTYQEIGSVRNDFAIIYGGAGSNVIGLDHQRTAQGTLYNQIIGQGSGNGDATQLTSTQTNATSAEEYYLHQTYISYDNINDQAQLDDAVASDLAMDSSLLEIPQFVITGEQLQTIPFLSVGDRVPVYFPGHPFFSSLDGQYFRIEILDCCLDDNDFEYELTLTMDNYLVDQDL